MMSLIANDFIVSGKKVKSKKDLEDRVKRNFTAHGNGPNSHTIEERICRSLYSGARQL